MITRTNYERLAHSRLHHLGEYVSFIRYPTLGTQRRDTSSTTQRALWSAATNTLGPLECLDLVIELNAYLQPHHDSLYLTDLKSAHSSLPHYTGFLRDLL